MLYDVSKNSLNDTESLTCAPWKQAQVKPRGISGGRRRTLDHKVRGLGLHAERTSSRLTHGLPSLLKDDVELYLLACEVRWPYPWPMSSMINLSPLSVRDITLVQLGINYLCLSC